MDKFVSYHGNDLIIEFWVMNILNIANVAAYRIFR